MSYWIEKPNELLDRKTILHNNNYPTNTLQNKQASKEAVAYCWHSPAWLFLV
jgi:hypothetical protein